MTGTEQNPALAWARSVVEGLVRAGVRHVCLSPGARSAPLAFALHERTAIRLTVHHDERSAAFFALGLARGSERPVALVCTSGSAGVNYAPAVVEASMSDVPLVVLTADRPPAQQDCGAGQAIDQQRLFAGYARWFADPGVPTGDPADGARVQRTIERAVRTALGPRPGPVQVNLPFEEPLAPLADDVWPLALAADAGPDALDAARPGPAPESSLAAARAALVCAARIVIVCGATGLSDAERDAVLALARACDAPIVADPTSGMRWPDAGHVAWAADWVLGDERTRDALRPDVFVRFGAMPTSKPVRRWMELDPDVPRIVVDPHGIWLDPTWGRAIFVQGDVESTARALAADVAHTVGRAEWRARFDRAHAAAAGQVSAALADGTAPVEGCVSALVLASLGEGDALHVASSMPIRDLDGFGAPDARRLHVTANRGANGIDGTASTALGAALAATARGARGVAVMGDVAALHDLGGLLAAGYARIDATLVVVNNDGGGIFGFLPVSAFGAASEKVFGTPHGRSFAHAAAMFGLPYARVDDVAALPAALACAAQSPGVSLVEVFTDRHANVAAWRALREQVAWHVLGALDARRGDGA